MPTEIPLLTRVDAVTLAYTEFESSFEQWLSTLVDIINEDLAQIEIVLASLDARITALGG